MLKKVMHFFTAPFRVYFTLASLLAILVPMWFVSILVNEYPFKETYFTAATWHGHEMVFAFPITVIMGFLLTASAHWTGKKTFTPRGLMIMTIIWFISRYIAFVQPTPHALLWFTTIPTIYLFLKMISVLKGNRNFIPITSILFLLLTANFLNIHANLNNLPNWIEISYILGKMAIFAIIFVFSGRLLPFFTNAKFKENLVALKTNQEIVTGAFSALYFASYLFDFAIIQMITAIVCFFLFSYRSIRIFHKKVLSEPMVLVLNIAHLFFPIYFAVRSFILIYPEAELGRSSLHTFFTGLLSMFAIAIMSRASLGHTGNEVKAEKLLKSTFILIFFGSLMRVFIPLIWQRIFDFTIHISMGTWTLGFIFFLIKFFPLFLKERK